MYSLDHKYFLQFMLKNSYISIDKALEFCHKHPIDVTDLASLKRFISVINAKITQQDLKLLVLKCEVTNDDALALVNTANDDITKLQNVYSANELEYFQLLLHELVVSENHRLKKMGCFNLTLIRGLTKDHIEKLLTKWIKNGYLVEKDSYVYLGARCIIEFAPYLSAHCKHFYSDCFLCSEAVFVGSTCASCNKIMHKSCLDKYLTKKNQCPECKRDWEDLEIQVTQDNDASTSE
ncbi:hypothetical protein RN001_014906 [Aquatica leii]|uniref:Non-structural maintenance of chromosomes element 1 homolog n=1 Tax=Aquatica leii TaxID=1421715 RepID=A0AAN7NYE0_9COLE|nr:hypothetical protein RN001_014906 [Aquatica leii]